jgi:class 3 adenylate cyclase
VAQNSESGVRTFLIGDIRGYTRYTVEHGDEAAAKLAQAFAELAADVARDTGGTLLEVRGDEILLVFASTRDAFRAAMELRQKMREARGAGESGMLAGVGIDAGEAVAIDGGFRGASLNRAARLCSLAGPDEVFATEVAVHLAGTVEGIVTAEREVVHLKGFTDAVRIMTLHEPGTSPAGVVPSGV